jgi:transposase-like protein
VTSVAKSFAECCAALRGRRVPCPDCGEALRPRGYAGPLKKLRGRPEGADARPGPRPRGQCDRCGRSHVLQPAAVAAYRSDTLLVLVRALLAHVLQGAGVREIAAVLGRAERTVRGWLAQARIFAQRHLRAFTAMLAAAGGQDLAPRIGDHDLVTELVTVLRAVAAAAARRWGDKGLPEWERVNLICRGRFLSPSLPVSFYHGLALR